METNPAIVAMAQQLAAQQVEIERLQRELAKRDRPVKKAKKDDREERAIRWMEKEYARQWEVELKKNAKRLAEIRKKRPGFMPVNDCLQYTLHPERYKNENPQR